MGLPTKRIRLTTISVIFSTIFIFSFLAYALPQSSGDDMVGVWMTQSKESMVEISKSGNSYIGKVLWLKFPTDPETGKPKLDKKNPDASLRSRPIAGLQILNDFTYSAEDKQWNGGTIYDPKSGSIYKCKATLPEKNTLNVRGYIGKSWMGLGRTETWKRIK
jgi:uncharacterized protein (DUF2147 family)